MEETGKAPATWYRLALTDESMATDMAVPPKFQNRKPRREPQSQACDIGNTAAELEACYKDSLPMTWLDITRHCLITSAPGGGLKVNALVGSAGLI